MASPASLPKRATSSERPPRGPSRVAKKPKGPWMRASSRHALSASHPRLAFASPVIRMARQRRVQRFILGAIGGDADEIVVGQSDERRFQRGCEREIVVRQQRRAARRHEIEHGDVLADIEPVGAGHRHACPFEGADHRLEGGAALAHQHEHVAGRPDAAHLVALGGPAFHRLRDAARDDDGRRMLLGLVDGQNPGFGLLFLGRRLDRATIPRGPAHADARTRARCRWPCPRRTGP